MLIKEVKYCYNDISVIPSPLSDCTSRSECNARLTTFNKGTLPIFASPMTSVVSRDNYGLFLLNGITPILPAIQKYSIEIRLKYANSGLWAAFSLSEVQEHYLDQTQVQIKEHPIKLLIDVANGHMKCLYDMSKALKEKYGDGITIMIGNIANPYTYVYAADAGVDFIRCSVGTGMGCLTSSNTSCHYPIASLLDELYQNKVAYSKENGIDMKKLPKIIADGGIRNYNDVIKALALGADAVMIGGLFGALIESAAPILELYGHEAKITEENGEFFFENGIKIEQKLHKVFYGMASKNGQIDRNGSKTKTSEGVSKVVEVTTNLSKWSENMEAYLKSAMSYTNVKDIEDFNPDNVYCTLISTNTQLSINK